MTDDGKSFHTSTLLKKPVRPETDPAARLVRPGLPLTAARARWLGRVLVCRFPAGIHRRDFNFVYSRERFEILLTPQICGRAETKFPSQKTDWERFLFFQIFFGFRKMFYRSHILTRIGGCFPAVWLLSVCCFSSAVSNDSARNQQ
jgi:hypothetical protein